MEIYTFMDIMNLGQFLENLSYTDTNTKTSLKKKKKNEKE